jgi:hypothetical protein
MMNRCLSLVAVVGLSLAGAACESYSANNDWSSTPNDRTSLNSNMNGSTNMNAPTASNVPSSDANNPTAHSPSDMGNLGNPDGTISNSGSGNNIPGSSGSTIDSSHGSNSTPGGTASEQH